MKRDAGNRNSEERRLEERVGQQARRLKQAEQDRRTLLGYSVYLGTLGVLFVLPVVAGAYLGRWLDGLMAGYSVRWTLSLIFLGIVIGAVNVYLFIRE
jgi:ATP synthase protein I